LCRKKERERWNNPSFLSQLNNRLTGIVLNPNYRDLCYESKAHSSPKTERKILDPISKHTRWWVSALFYIRIKETDMQNERRDNLPLFVSIKREGRQVLFPFSLPHFFVHTLEHTYGGKFDNTFSLSLSVCLSFPSSLSFCLIVSSLNGAEKGFGVSFWVQNCKLQSSHICPVKTRVKIILYIQPTPTCANLHLYRN